MVYIHTLVVSVAFAHEVVKLNPIDAKFRLNFENVSLPANENMGLVGGTALYDIENWLSIGPGAYGALTGERGGFITIGMAANLQQQLIEHLLLDGGLFLGAGGGEGGYTLSGGGLMLRTHGGLYLTSRNFGNIGAGVSYIDFPNGAIHSFQPYVAYEYPFTMYAAPNWIQDYLTGDIPPANQEIALVYKNYFLQSTTGNLGLLGMQWMRDFYNNFFVSLESEGAVSGNNSGYMQILLGGGLRKKIFTKTIAKLIGEAGVAGGGGASTGGGLLLDGGLSLQQYLTNSIYISLLGDYAAAPSGDLRAYSAGVQLGYAFMTPDSADIGLDNIFDTSPYLPRTLRIRGTNQTYLQANEDWRHHHADETVNNLGIQLDYFLNKNFYLSGQGIAAYAGNAGAYMAGMVGPGVYLPLFKSPVFLDFEALAAAAGGGGLDINGGFALQGNSGIGVNIWNGLSIMAYYGYISAVQGKFKSNVIGGTLAYDFTMFSKST